MRAWIASYDCPDYYSFWCGGVFFCVLNSMLFWEDSREEVADREAQVREWLDALCVDLEAEMVGESGSL